MEKAKDYYKADYTVLDTKKMINKGKLLGNFQRSLSSLIYESGLLPSWGYGGNE